MTQTGENSPLIITKEAMTQLAFVKINKKIDENKRLRVKSRINAEMGVLGFDMFFDGNQSKNDMVYTMNGMELILDLATAYHLIGSTLDVDKKGEFLFSHLEMIDQFQDLSNIQYN